MASRYLSDVDDDKVFWLSNGQRLKSLKELRNALTSMPQDVFYHHVDQSHNDFANWIRDVIKDGSLAGLIKNSRSMQDHILKINSRIMDLEGTGHKLPKKTKSSKKKISANKKRSKSASKPKKSQKRKAFLGSQKSARFLRKRR